MSFSGTKGYITKPKPGVMLNPLHPLSNGLVGCWLFNEGAGSLANDISGKGNHGILTNMAPNTQGSGWGGSKFGGGLMFDEVDDRVDCGSGNSLDATTELTVSTWIKQQSLAVRKTIITKWDYQTQGCWVVETQSPASDEIEVFIANALDDAGSNLARTTNLKMIAGNWYNIVFVYDGNGATNADKLKIYANGIIKMTSYIGTIQSSLQNSSASVKIGNWGGSLNRPFNGSIDYARIYNRALSADEIKQLYNNPFCDLLQVPIRRYSVVAPVGAIMNQFQRANLGADLYNGVLA